MNKGFRNFCNLFIRGLKFLRSQLEGKLVNLQNNFEIYKQWWRKNGYAWSKTLATLMIKYCNIGLDWQFNSKQKKLLKEYYDANQLLVACLNSDCYLSREVRQEIENTLLLPYKDKSVN